MIGGNTQNGYIAEGTILKTTKSLWIQHTSDAICMVIEKSGLPLGGRTPYITSKNRLCTSKLHIKDVPRTSENSLVRPKMVIETSCL